ncbi:MAG: polysaccharide deacetylase family protein [Bacillaceae bacterium]|nr:polysaccharide deacetylase family protein [Bacillaceae bacterium]
MKPLILLTSIVHLLVGCVILPEELDTTSSEIVIKSTEDVNEGQNKEQIEEVIREEENTTEVVEKIDSDNQTLPQYYLHNNVIVKPLAEDVNEKVVLLTIDDAPEKYSLLMAELLKEEGINAIFFVNGHFLNTDVGQAKLREIYELGFEIGNHTMTHPNLRNIDPVEQKKQIVELNDLVEEIIGKRPRFFRAPFGVNTETSKEVVAEEGMQWMNWSYGYDFQPEYMEKEALAEIMVNTNLLSPGANLLMHDRKFTLEALPVIIAGLRDKGYNFVDPRYIK